jgi:hypothetical protein
MASKSAYATCAWHTNYPAVVIHLNARSLVIHERLGFDTLL